MCSFSKLKLTTTTTVRALSGLQNQFIFLLFLLLQVPEARREQKVKAQDGREEEDSQPWVQRGEAWLCFFSLTLFFFSAWKTMSFWVKVTGRRVCFTITTTKKYILVNNQSQECEKNVCWIFYHINKNDMIGMITILCNLWSYSKFILKWIVLMNLIGQSDSIQKIQCQKKLGAKTSMALNGSYSLRQHTCLSLLQVQPANQRNPLLLL